LAGTGGIRSGVNRLEGQDVPGLATVGVRHRGGGHGHQQHSNNSECELHFLFLGFLDCDWGENEYMVLAPYTEIAAFLDFPQK